MPISQMTPQDRVLQFALGATVAEIDSLMGTLRVIRGHKSGVSKKIAAGKQKAAASASASASTDGAEGGKAPLEPGRQRAKRSDAGKKKQKGGGSRTGADEVNQDSTQAPSPAETSTAATPTSLSPEEQRIAQQMLDEERAAQG